MSFDLVVFDVASAPRQKDAFLAWYEEQAQWAEGHGYDDVSRTTPELRAWYHELVQEFPPMHGPDAPEEEPEDNGVLADYCIGTVVIYVSFGWSKAVTALDQVVQLAKKHHLGFFNVSSKDKNLWLPDKTGELVEIEPPR